MFWTLTDFRFWWRSNARHRWMRLHRAPSILVDIAPFSVRYTAPSSVYGIPRSPMTLPTPRNLTNFGDLK